MGGGSGKAGGSETLAIEPQGSAGVYAGASMTDNADDAENCGAEGTGSPSCAKI